MESYDIKAFSAEDVSDMITQARADFAAECRPEDKGICRICKDGLHGDPVNRAQHWNDVGGPDTLECEWCWVTSIIDFQMQEKASELTNE